MTLASADHVTNLNITLTLLLGVEQPWERGWSSFSKPVQLSFVPTSLVILSSNFSLPVSQHCEFFTVDNGELIRIKGRTLIFLVVLGYMLRTLVLT